jgi:hypothetical protein
MDLEALRTAVDELVRTDPALSSDGESVVEVLSQLQRLEAVATRMVGALDASKEWAVSGARTAPAWLATECRLPPRRCRDLVSRARRLRELPHTEAAWLAGQVAVDHVDRLGAARKPRCEEDFDRDEAVLVGWARSERFTRFHRDLRYWEQLADPDGADASDEAKRTRRDAWLVQSFSGVWMGSLTLDPVSGAIVSNELVRIEQALFEADWAEAKERLVGAGETREPTVADLARTPNQRRADALVEMATRSAACPEGARRPAPLFSVLIDEPTMKGRICELANGWVVAPGSLLRYLEAADIERVVFSGDNRVEVGPTNRFFTGATRRALELRDRECAHRYCEERFDRCQADHITEFAKGGPTVQENGRLLCPFHNRLRNQRRRE